MLWFNCNDHNRSRGRGICITYARNEFCIKCNNELMPIVKQADAEPGAKKIVLPCHCQLMLRNTWHQPNLVFEGKSVLPLIANCDSTTNSVRGRYKQIQCSNCCPRISIWGWTSKTRHGRCFPKSMNIRSGEVLAVCEPATKIFYHNRDLTDKNVDEIKTNSEIAALILVI